MSLYPDAPLLACPWAWLNLRARCPLLHVSFLPLEEHLRWRGRGRALRWGAENTSPARPQSVSALEQSWPGLVSPSLPVTRSHGCTAFPTGLSLMSLAPDRALSPGAARPGRLRPPVGPPAGVQLFRWLKPKPHTITLCLPPQSCFQRHFYGRREEPGPGPAAECVPEDILVISTIWTGWVSGLFQRLRPEKLTPN